MSDNIHWPGSLPGNPLKRLVKVLVGRVLAVLQPARYRRVQRGELVGQPDWVERQMMVAWTHHCLRSGKPEALAPLHQWAWRDDASSQHHADTHDRFHQWWEAGHGRIVPALVQSVSAQSVPYTRLVEIGCGEALALPGLRAALPDVEHYIGLDLSAEQSRRNIERLGDDRTRFEQADAMAWLPAKAAPGTIYMTIGGVFEYFTQAQVEAMYAAIARQGPATIAVVEPLAADYDLEAERDSRPFPPEHSFAHNHPALLEAAGFHVDSVDECTLLHRWLMVVAHRP